jgi:hypothetical protein
LISVDVNCCKSNIKNRIEGATEAAVTAFALEQPVFGQVRVSGGLCKRDERFISLSKSYNAIWMFGTIESPH